MQNELHILLLEDSSTDAELIERELRKAGMNFTSKRVESQKAFAHALRDFHPDIVLSDYNLPGFGGVAALAMVRLNYPETPVIIVTGALSDKDAANLIRLGAKDYVLKDRLARLAPAVQRALSVEHGVRVRKLTEAQLQEKTELLENVINSSTDYIFVKDRGLRTILCNDVFARALGKKPEELYGKTDIENGWDAELVKGNPEKGIYGFEQDDLAALAGNVVHSATDLGNVGGEIRHFDSVKVPLKSSNGKIFGMLGISRDVTERRLMEENLRKSEARYRSLFKNMLNGFAYCRMQYDDHSRPVDFVYLDVNEAFYQFSGLKDVIGKPVSELIPGIREQNPEVFEIYERVIATGKPERFELDIKLLGKWHDISVYSPEKEHFIAIFEDITERKQAEELLRFHSNILQNLAEGVFLIRASDGVIVFANPQFERLFGYESGELFGKHVSIVNAPGEKNPQAVATAIMAELEQAGVWNGEVQNIRKDGTPFWCHANVSTFDHPQFGKVWVSAHEDITERIKSEERLRLTAKVFENTMEGITITDKDNNILEVNDAFTRITGYSRKEVIGKTPSILMSGLQDKNFYAAMWQAINTTGHWRGDIWNRRKDGEVYPELLTISTITDDKGKVTHYVGIFSDITLIKQHEKQLEHIAHYDALTGIPNRVLLSDRLKQAIAYSKREKKLLAVCYLDLDGFKAINDSAGHEAGDQVLIEISRRIRDTVREGDTVARLGGDEFVVLLTGLEEPEECAGSLNRLLEAASQPIPVNGQSFKLSTSIGVSLYPHDNEDPDILVRHADQAMYAAKQAGRNRYHLYDPSHDQRARSFRDLTNRIQQGLARNEFELFFQPKVNLRSGRPVGAEALIRWRHPELGLISPAEFLHTIEDTELDIEVGEWVIAAALDQLGKWQQDGLDLELSLNVSAFHLQSPGFAEKLGQKLLQYPSLPHGKLQIEILETAALKDITAATRIIESCRNFGVVFALDDFGTGYSSLSYLSNLPVDTLKIDQSFIRDMLDDKGDFAIVQGIIALSKAFNLKTVAEGVETDKCFSALLDMGCETAQGYVIARPMPAVDFSAWYREKCNSVK